MHILLSRAYSFPFCRFVPGREYLHGFFTRSGNNMHRNNLTYFFDRCSTSIYGSLDSSHITLHKHGHKSSPTLLQSEYLNIGLFYHGIHSLYCTYQTFSFNHSYSLHLILLTFIKNFLFVYRNMFKDCYYGSIYRQILITHRIGSGDSRSNSNNIG